MKVAYSDRLRLSKDNVVRLETINEIIEEYVQQNFVLSLRQLYYQLVSRMVIPNNQREYAKLSKLLTQGRMAGVVDWGAIEDRGRKPHLPYWVQGVKHALNDTADTYRLNRQKGQKSYIEVWSEKDALSNIFYRITSKYHVQLQVNKGYSSSSAMHDAYLRFLNSIHDGHKQAVIIYFGDHDPSGIDMARDIKDRILEFGEKHNFTEKHFQIIRPALTMKQVQDFNLPENPAKLTDPRAKWYIDNYGEHSWELDALPPQELSRIAEENIKKHIDLKQYNYMLKLELKERREVEQMALDYEGDDSIDVDDI